MKKLRQRINEEFVNESRVIELDDEWGNLEEFQKSMKPKLRKLWDEYLDEVSEGTDYKTLKKWEKVFKPHGLTFDYGLDGISYDFKLKI